MQKSSYLVAGLGKTGHSIAAYLSKRQHPFFIFDTREKPEGYAQIKAEFPQAEIFLETLPAAIYPLLKEIIASPGVDREHPVFQKAYGLNIPIIGDIECLAREISAPVIAITGTNGKSTVTTLVGEMAKAFGLSVAVAGNIGSPVLDLLDAASSYDAWILELSSFQLELVQSLAPRASTILNISPDHMDRHHSLKAYIKAKQNVYSSSTLAIYNRDDKQAYPCEESIKNIEKISSYGLDQPTIGQWGILDQPEGSYLAKGLSPLIAVDALRIKGKHNWQNALAACALAETLGIDQKSMSYVLQRFTGLAHRCQWLRKLDAVDWINDSKGTNIGATISAISGIGSGLSGKIVLIAGGLGKGADFSLLKPCVKAYVSQVLLIGKDAPEIESALASTVPIKRAKNLEQAVFFAKELAKAQDIVLLSPACASQDMFRDFNHRGEEFAHWVNLL